MSKENFYVAVTRGRSGVDILTSDVERLRDSVTRSEERRSAVELERDRIQMPVIGQPGWRQELEQTLEEGHERGKVQRHEHEWGIER